MKYLQSAGAGLAGASALTLLHETVRRFNPDAPRMDLLGMRAIDKYLRKAAIQPPRGKPLHTAALVGDMLSNTLYYSLAGAGKKDTLWLRGAGLGLAAGIGAIVLPGPMGLGDAPSSRTPQTKAMTIAWYLAGGLATATVLHWLNKSSKPGSY
jgi:hypothetical protein